MKYEDIEKFIGKKVSVICTDKQILRGLLTNTESKFDTSSGEEEIELSSLKADICYGIPFSEIEKIELMMS